MKKTIITLALTTIIAIGTKAQTYVETFDTNSLGWTENTGENNSGTTIIDRGVMTIKYQRSSILDISDKINGYKTFESHCYAPLDINNPFEITANVKIENLDLDHREGLIFNYRDFGTYYAFVFDKESVSFLRVIDGRLVGSITQDIKWDKEVRGKQDQAWKLISDNGELQFYINDKEMMKVRHMPLDFTGVGFLIMGRQTLIVDDVTFSQK